MKNQNSVDKQPTPYPTRDKEGKQTWAGKDCPQKLCLILSCMTMLSGGGACAVGAILRNSAMYAAAGISCATSCAFFAGERVLSKAGVFNDSDDKPRQDTTPLLSEESSAPSPSSQALSRV